MYILLSFLVENPNRYLYELLHNNGLCSLGMEIAYYKLPKIMDDSNVRSD